MSVYVETQSDAAFTLWLATVNKRTVAAERHVRLSKPERQVLAFHEAAIPAPPKPARQGFTDRQITIALAAMAARENTKTRSK